MTDPLTIPAGEIGVLRLFELDMPREQVKFLRDEPAALADLLGVSDINAADVEIFPVSDLDNLGLPGYLREGHAIPEDQITADRNRLRAQTGYILVLHSRAFGGQATTLTPASALVPIGTYTATPADWTARPLPTPESAKPHSGPVHSPRAARDRARRVGAAIFILVMLFVALLLWLILA